MPLQLVRQLGPIAAHRLHTDDFETLVRTAAAQPGIPFCATALAAAHRRQQEARIVFLELQFQMRLDPVFGFDMPRQLVVDLRAERRAHCLRFNRGALVGQTWIDKNRIRISIDHPHAAFLQTFLRPAQDIMPEFSDRPSERVRRETTTARR